MAASFTKSRLAGNCLDVPVFNLSKFMFIKPEAKLVAEASDLNGFRLGRLWNDACDVGLAIESHLTGRYERFFLARQTHRDGEITSWELEPVSATCPIKLVVIFND